MLRAGILNPHLLSLLARFRHTNTLVIADRGFPFWPGVETLDLSVVDDLPTVLQVLAPIRTACSIGRVYMATEFEARNDRSILKRWEKATRDLSLHFEAHEQFKRRVPQSLGLIRTADSTPYANMILESA